MAPIGWDLHTYRLKRVVSLKRLAATAHMTPEEILRLERKQIIPIMQWRKLRKLISRLALDKL